MEYLNRIADKELRIRLEAFGAVLENPKPTDPFNPKLKWSLESRKNGIFRSLECKNSKRWQIEP